jgi:asparagine synthetase B (glutamine-hydrolysing)
VPQRRLLRAHAAARSGVTEERVWLSPVESAVDDAIGEHASQPPLPIVPSTLTPLQALEDAVLQALQRPPCVVMFSGGRDSSLVLAVATRVARQAGLPLPIPTTHVFPDYPDTDESAWQAMALRHLRLSDHHRQIFRGELNLLGPVVRASIRRHGLVAPAGSHLIVPTLAEARGGSVLTGMDGDGLLNGGSFGQARAVLRNGVRPTVRMPLTFARALAPRRLRRAVARRRAALRVPWLRVAPLTRLLELDAAEIATEPFRWNRYVAWWARRRYFVARRQAMALLAETHEVRLAHPLMEPRFLATVSRAGGAWGWGNRTMTLRALFAGLLPDALLARESKADFTRAYWGNDTRNFIATWDGTGVPADLVDVDALREVWADEMPDARTGLLLHAAWAATLRPDERKEPFNCRLE